MLRDSHRARARASWACLERAVLGAILLIATATDALPDDRAAAADIHASAAFLYGGDHPVQAGVAPGTIDATRVAVIRGQVSARDGRRLPGVRIAILDHPELGSTLTRADGSFDLAVNGGGFLTVTFRREGHLPAHRRVRPAWRDWAWTDPVVLVPLDRAVSEIEAGAGAAQVARGGRVTDGDGTRQATVVFPAGTSATVTLPDGARFALGALHVRATEYTVGHDGRAALPAPLPPSTAYTYAVELSVDEAVRAGAREVTFSRPVPVYLENFLDIPVGAQVPAGLYDRTRGAWVPWEDGRVIRILTTEGGVATVDADGSGAEDDGPALGITPDEARQLATLYAPGQTLWRVPVPRSGAWAFSYAYACLADEHGEYCASPRTIPRLSRSAGRPGAADAERTVTIPIPGRWPSTATAFSYIVDVAGQRHAGQLGPREGTEVVVRWDGRDGFGRVVLGSAPVAVWSGWVYRPVLAAVAAPGSGPPARTFASGTPGWSHQGFERLGGDGMVSWATWTGAFGAPTTWPQRVGARPVAAVGSPDGLAVGPDGSVYTAEDDVVRRIDPAGRVTVFAGQGDCAGPQSGVPATEACVHSVRHVTVGPDGSVYLSGAPARGAPPVRRVRPDGLIEDFAGVPAERLGSAPVGDEGPAVGARIGSAAAVAAAPDGSVYVLADGRIRRVSPDGHIHAYAGAGACESFADAGLAVRAGLCAGGGSRALAPGASGPVRGPDLDTGGVRRRHRPERRAHAAARR